MAYIIRQILELNQTAFHGPFPVELDGIVAIGFCAVPGEHPEGLQLYALYMDISDGTKYQRLQVPVDQGLIRELLERLHENIIRETPAGIGPEGTGPPCPRLRIHFTDGVGYNVEVIDTEPPAKRF